MGTISQPHQDGAQVYLALLGSSFGDSEPFRVFEPKFIRADIGQSRIDTGVSNSICVTFALNVDIFVSENFTIKIGNLSGITHPIGPIPIYSCDDLRIPSHSASMDIEFSSLSVNLEFNLHKGISYAFGFDVVNPTTPQSSPDIYIMAVGPYNVKMSYFQTILPNLPVISRFRLTVQVENWWTTEIFVPENHDLPLYSYVRIGDELMTIVESTEREVIVQRCVHNTVCTKHIAGETVFAYAVGARIDKAVQTLPNWIQSNFL
ncbi:hypothetical protein GUITHDRAFT_102310 [Guillardia theta CCMP2712]|uniref:Uncharacterized protein n=1 Tax=Guillardia theta (strain CCMP2712) TaxID=905079 RepID=L1JTQ8_GUITC|nr:hypothetical protein GUITHDRAFT_102310 [Guillardia theta CCMP2712]EKX51704.1 hypothetical protein GUITHDRAFT_102310 [Guillardia theta CCMP2712]|eukprot:XP_005838684.1 hypothetical protein GUITHDRAFT_102310 [Guillardia theta CCMP2712]